MKISWIDWDNSRLNIPPEMAKNAETSRIIIPDGFMTQLKDVYKLHLYDQDLYLFTKFKMPGKYKIGQNTLANRFRKVRRDLGMPESYKLYSWKHTGAILASDAGVPIKHLQQQLRHKNLETTDVYLSKARGFESDQIRNWAPGL